MRYGKEERHGAIRRLIGNTRIESQEELRSLLAADGFAVTQATLSRDLRQMQVDKVSAAGTGYYYAIHGEEQLNDHFRGWLSLEFSGNLGVVRTLPGHAGSIAVAIDSSGFDSVLGTVAGDDTVLVVLKDRASSTLFISQLRKVAPELASEGAPDR